MRLRVCSFKHEYRSGSDNLIVDFYHRALKCSTLYWRAVGFFSSSALEAIGAPLGEFIASGGSMRLITSVCLEQDDMEAIERGIALREVCERRLLDQLRTEFASPFGKGASLLTQMLASGALEIRIAVPAQGIGIYHEKVGVFQDAGDDFVAFSGSSNESRSALQVNYECVDVFTSWEDGSRAQGKKQHFEQLWEGSAPGTCVFTFPEAAKRELIRQASRTGHDDDIHVREPSVPLSKWRHQDEAVAAFMAARRGVLEMATGTGKTRTALRICQQLVDQGRVDTVIVCTDGTDLLDQWYLELAQLTRALPQQYAIYRHYENFRERDGFIINPVNSILLCSRMNVSTAMKRLSDARSAHTLIVYDEAHGLGSPANRNALEGLSDRIAYRLGLSATPEREYDDDGNSFLERHVGPVIFTFGLDDAISRGILAPFSYFPLEYEPDQNDRDRLQAVFRKAAGLARAGTPMSDRDKSIEMARVYKTSLAKLPLFEAFLARYHHLLRRSIIFVEDREYGEAVLPLVHRYLPEFHTYYAEDDRQTLQRFAKGDLQCLLTCHRVSEGIDIRSIETVVLFSSARARLETIQRIGRCLRADPENPSKRANVVDFVRVDTDRREGEEPNGDRTRMAWLQSLAQIHPSEEA